MDTAGPGVDKLGGPQAVASVTHAQAWEAQTRNGGDVSGTSIIGRRANSHVQLEKASVGV